MVQETVKNRVTAMARDILGPPMKARGFRRTGRVFWRNTPAVCQVICLQMSWWGTRDSGRFDVFMGVYWHEVEQLQGAPPGRRIPPPYSDCTFSIDLGWTTPAGVQKGWDVDLNTDWNDLGDELLNDILNYGIPWLQHRSDLAHTLDGDMFLRRSDTGAWSTHESMSGFARICFLSMAGRREDARRQLEEYLADDDEVDRVTALANRLGFKLNERRGGESS